MTLDDVRVYLGVCRIVQRRNNGYTDTIDSYTTTDKNGAPDCINGQYFRLTNEQWNSPVLAMDDKFSVDIDHPFPEVDYQRFDAADLSIVVSFRPRYWPLRREKEFGYYAAPQPDGKLEWRYRPRG